MSDMEFDEYQLPQVPAAPEPNGNGNGPLTIRSMNQNLGAVRVGVVRDMKAVHDRVRIAAMYGGRSFEYRIPFKKRIKDARGRPVLENGKPKVITEFVVGPTVDCTNAVAGCYGNCSLRAEIVDIRPDAYVIEATFLDIETGFQMTRPFVQARDRNIGGMGGDAGRVQEAITGIGVSKALRNVVRNALGPLVEYCTEYARRDQADKVKSQRPQAEAAVVNKCEEFKVPLARIEKYYGAKLADMSPRVVAQVLGLLNSVRDDLIRPDEVCPEGDAAPAQGEPVPERQEREREDATDDEARDETVDDDGVVTTNGQEAQQQAQETRQEPEAKEEDPKPAAKGKAAGKAAKPAAPPPSEEEPKQAQVYWQVFSPDGKVARRMPADPEGWWLAFSDENEAVPKAQRQTFYNANMRRLREVAETIPVAKTFLEFIEKA